MRESGSGSIRCVAHLRPKVDLAAPPLLPIVDEEEVRVVWVEPA